MIEKGRKIAVIGSGVAGLTAAYILSREYDVILFEKNSYLGGHTNTVIINSGPDEGTPVDTGFIVMNHRNYPLLTELFTQLEVDLRDSDMSFGYMCPESDVEYSSTGVSGLYSRRRNIFNLKFQNMVYDLFRFYKNARRDLAAGTVGEGSLGDYLHKHKMSDYFIRHHILPMGSAIWSTPDSMMLDFPAISFLNFFKNHNLLGVTGQPVWRTVVGGSHSYVKVMKKFLKDVHLNSPVNSVTRKNGKVHIAVHGGENFSADGVVIAAHADQALRLLGDPTSDEKRLLGPWRYQLNKTILHTYESILPGNLNSRASWNFLRKEKPGGLSSLSLTYDMNRLQGLNTENKYLVTLNSSVEIPQDNIITEIDYEHPLYNLESMNTQAELKSINGVNNTYFCGSYFGYGFHEDAVRSAVDVAALFGMSL